MIKGDINIENRDKINYFEKEVILISIINPNQSLENYRNYGQFSNCSNGTHR